MTCSPRPRLEVGVRGAALALLLSLCAAFAIAATASDAGAQVKINEIRTDQAGADNDEYFELAGPPGTALTGHHLIVIGDGPGCGLIEAAVNLGAFSIQADGFFVAAEATFTLGAADATVSLNFENADNVTFLLVTGFMGGSGQDLDVNDDGTLDVTPWTSLVDGVALIGTGAIDCVTNEYVYSATTVGPDGAAVPQQVYRCGDTDVWQVGSVTLGVTDTPGAANQNCVSGVGDARAGDGLWMVPHRNPFAISTEIGYRIPGRPGDLVAVKLAVVDVQGRVVTTLVSGKQGVGEHTVTLDGRKLGRSGSGMYFLNLTANGRVVTRKISYLP